MPTAIGLREWLGDLVAARNRASRAFFEREAEPLAHACREMASRFARGGRLWAFGAGSAATDAQHVAVEFVHPVIVGKRALPAIDLSAALRPGLPAGLIRPDDIVMGFSAAAVDAGVAGALREARALGAQTLALPGAHADYAVSPADPDPFIHQELMEVLYHTLWETVHVFFEHGALNEDAGDAAFLYPFLGRDDQETGHLVTHVADSIRVKARESERLRSETLERQGDELLIASHAIHDRIARGGALLLFGNGGSATDAADWAIDCTASPKGHRPIPALSLASDAAIFTAIANDVGQETTFLRQIIAYARPDDVAVAISTSGGSANVIAALEEARRRGLLTLALAGYDGGEIGRRALADHRIVVPSESIPRIQEVHASLYHMLLDVLNAMEKD
jgi:D-sedoheptulose 7-phosphate isomerase